MSEQKTNHFRIVVCGEHNSGKSSLINLMLNTDVLPLSVIRVENPIQRVFHSDKEQVVGITPKGAKKIITEADLTDSLAQFKDVAYFAPTENLLGAEIIEIQVSTVDQLTADMLDVINTADFFIWCSNATQAWRNTEQEVVKSFENLTQKNAMLVLSRGDHLSKKADATKILTRIKSGDLFQEKFSDVIMLHASSSEKAWKKSAAAWKATGIAPLVQKISKLPNVKNKLPEALLERYNVLTLSPSPIVEDPQPKEPTKNKPAPKKTTAKAPAATKAESKQPAIKKPPAKAAPKATNFSANIDKLVETAGFKSGFVFDLNEDQPLQQIVVQDSDTAFTELQHTAKLFKALNPNETDEMTVIMSEAKNWTLFKFSDEIENAVCVVRISRSAGNLATTQRRWSSVEFTLANS